MKKEQDKDHPKFPSSPTGETDELCDRGEGQQCYRHPSHMGIHVYDADHPLAKLGKLTKG